MKFNIGLVKIRRIKFFFIFLFVFFLIGKISAQEFVMSGASSSIISSMAEVPAGTKLVFTSGLTASASNADLPESDYEKYGDTKTQAISILEKFKTMLEAKSLDFSNAFSMKVYVSKDPRKGIFDFAGWNEAYKMYFGTVENPNKPVRSTVGVAELVNPNKLIEIELILAQ